ncbi:hypothetical protein GBAR_LOCUS27789 [Geodia barretti]|uniref:Uncharacterized protein n=1 Tax=Geodia barretti TaxID=519541 RepID=A0AA35TML3_GEOBA|nr:hypothetical protein GBAR_LOCUS27789 [Geodia barretti]
MAGSSHLLHTLYLVLCLAAMALLAPPETGQEMPSDSVFNTEGTSIDAARYTEAVPSNDFSLNNISSTIEEILAEAHVERQGDSDLSSQTSVRLDFKLSLGLARSQ